MCYIFLVDFQLQCDVGQCVVGSFGIEVVPHFNYLDNWCIQIPREGVLDYTPNGLLDGAAKMKKHNGKQIPAGGLDPDAKKEIPNEKINSELNKERKLFFNFRKDQKKYDQIYGEFSPLIFKFLIKRTGDHLEAEDLTQETFCRAFSGLGKFEWRGISLQAYLFQIARNAFNSWYKKKVANGEFIKNLNDEEMGGGGEVDGDLQTAEYKAILGSCLGNLTANQRDAIELFYWNKLRTREIALIMNTRESTVKSHLQRGRQAVKLQLQEMGLDFDSFGLFTEPEEMPTIKNSFWSFMKKPRRECSQ